MQEIQKPDETNQISNGEDYFPEINFTVMHKEAKIWAQKFPETNKISLYNCSDPGLYGFQYVLVWFVSSMPYGSMLTFALSKNRILSKSFINVYRIAENCGHKFREDWNICAILNPEDFPDYAIKETEVTLFPRAAESIVDTKDQEAIDLYEKEIKIMFDAGLEIDLIYDELKKKCRAVSKTEPETLKKTALEIFIGLDNLSYLTKEDLDVIELYSGWTSGQEPRKFKGKLLCSILVRDGYNATSYGKVYSQYRKIPKKLRQQ